MNVFAQRAAKATSEIVQDAGLDGYEVDVMGLADDLEDKAREIAALLRQGDNPDGADVSGPLVDLHQIILGLLDAYAEVFTA